MARLFSEIIEKWRSHKKAKLFIGAEITAIGINGKSSRPNEDNERMTIELDVPLADGRTRRFTLTLSHNDTVKLAKRMVTAMQQPHCADIFKSEVAKCGAVAN